MSAPDFRLDGRTAFISGAAGHLGKAMAEALGSAGAHLLLNGRNAERLEKFAADLRGKGMRADCAAFDVTDFARVRTYFSALPRLDILVSNAITMSPKPMAELSPADFEETYRSSVVASFEMIRAARSALASAARASGDASVINISSMYGVVSPDARIYASRDQASPAHYGAAKAALLQLTRHLAAELGPERIRVNALVPGPFPQPSVRTRDPQFAERLAGRTMLGRTGEPAEIAGPVLFLASRASSFMTGASLAIDGGWTAW
jgi:NAD(P)-dependent dehydrogenase (short-subunit alcohol dehydrogenase family)